MQKSSLPFADVVVIQDFNFVNLLAAANIMSMMLSQRTDKRAVPIGPSVRHAVEFKRSTITSKRSITWIILLSQKIHTNPIAVAYVEENFDEQNFRILSEMPGKLLYIDQSKLKFWVKT